jgi:hypothetical protein
VPFPARQILCVLTSCVVVLCGAATAGATVYVSPSGSDTAPCTQAAPCRNFERAVTVSPAGGEVEAAAGSYGGQSLENVPAKASSAKVIVRPAAGAAVTTGYLNFDNTDNVEVRSMTTSGWGIRGNSAHIVLRDVKALDASSGGYFGGADDVKIIGGEIGRIDPEDGIHFNNAYGTNSNITIDGLFEHDLTRDKDPTSHDDCIQTGDVTNLVIRNSRFFNCGTQGIFMNPYNGGATKNITLENNWFGTAQLGYNIIYVGEAQGVVMRNNSITGGMYIDNPTSSGVKMVNNIVNVDSYTCSTLADGSDVFDYNLTPNSCAGATHHLVKSGVVSQFVNGTTTSAAAFDLHLKAGAAGIDKGSPSDSAANDFDGQTRPIGGAPDIGADEYGTGPQGPPTPPGPTPPSGGATTPTPTPKPKPPAGGAGSTPATTAAARAAVLETLPDAAAAALSRTSVVQAGTKAPLTGAGIDARQICRVARKSCRNVTSLRIVTSRASKARLQLRRVWPGHRSKLVRVTTVRLKKGTNVILVRARGLRAARYHVVLRTTNGATADLPLTVKQ